MYEICNWVEFLVWSTYRKYLIWDAGWAHRRAGVNNGVGREAKSWNGELENA